MNYISEHKEGFWGTVVVHGVILILLLVFGFFTPLPLPGEEGILINFGNSEQGSGNEEPAPALKQNISAPDVEKKSAVQSSPPPATTPAVSKAKEEVMTQDFEKTVAVESAAEAEARKKQEELDRRRKLAEQKKLEEEREKERQAEIAREQQEKERLEKEAEQKKIIEINSRAANAFGSTGAETTNSKSTSQGVTFPAGNQGNPKGTSDHDNYEKGGSADGSAGSGPSFSLSGRDALSLPRPAYPGNEEGIVVVAVTVDKYGKVTNAEAGVQGSTTYNTALIRAAKEAALKARFNAAPSATAFQKGTITYRFVLD